MLSFVMQIWQLPMQWSLHMSWAWRIVSWKKLSISNKLFLTLPRIARNYLGLQQQMIWTILHWYHQTWNVFWNMWYWFLTLLTSPSIWSALSCELAKTSVVVYQMGSGSCLNTFLWQVQFVTSTMVRSLWQSSINWVTVSHTTALANKTMPWPWLLKMSCH